MPQEIPPTAGLPVRWRELSALSGNLAARLADRLSIPEPALTCSGTAALIMILRVLRQRHPHRCVLIVPAFTCPLVALAAGFCPPLTVVPCDLAPNGIDLDSQHLAQLCDHRTLAVVVTHLAGRVVDVDSAKAVAAACGAAVIEDAAQAMGARDDGQSVGLKGDAAFFSMAFGKGLTSAEGGVLFSRDPELHRALHQQCRQDLPFRLGWEIRRIAELAGYALFYHPRGLYYVYGRPLRRALARGDRIQAVGDDFSRRDIPLHRLGGYRRRVAAGALKRLPAFLESGRERALRRIAALRELPGVGVLTDTAGREGVWPFILLLMPNPSARDAAMDSLWTAGLGVTRLFIHTLYGYPAVAPLLGLTPPCPHADDFAARSLSISNSPWLTDKLFNDIVEQLRTVLA
ncbi:nucleotide sugar aminotransferase [Martelella alba]|uniref:Nucleotide sugar aminotransferase n=1 Tax=Martelella alba TaxID=2590451 RepID=A0ABY2SIV5_9HYPH|nr:nucleotide sugar aminotransferase [Martelella alba]